MTVERKTHSTDASKVKPGDLMAIIHYIKVNTIAPNASRMNVVTLDSNTQNLDVIGKELITNALSADYYAEEVKTTMTDVAQKLVESHNRPLTVCFLKQPSKPKKGEKRGEERILRGRLLAHEVLLGRSHVEDLDKPVGDRVRLVDHRTIKWLIVDGVKYVVGK